MAQRVLITAGASGIGKDMAMAFTKTGAKVFICDIDAKALEATAQELPGLVTKACDVSNRTAVEDMVAYGVQILGGFDVLVNNAGIAGPTAPVEEISKDDWEKVVQVNLNGTFHVTRLVITYLKSPGPVSYWFCLP